MKYLESLMILGHHSPKGMKLLAAVLHECPWMGKQSRRDFTERVAAWVDG